MVKMKKIRTCRKGILFTLGLTFLTLVVLSLAILIFHNAQKYEEITAKLAALDRVYELDTSIGQSLKDIFRLRSGISINVTNESISFEENMPNYNLEILNNSIDSFKRFIESNLSNVNLTITDMDEVPLMISPYNIAYTHKENGSDIEVLPASINFDGYFVSIDTDKNVSCAWDEQAGTLNLSLEVRVDELECEFESKKVGASTEVSINSIEDGNILLIQIGDNGKLVINMTQNVSMTTKTSVLIDQNQAEIESNSMILKVDFGELGIYKESEVKII